MDMEELSRKIVAPNDKNDPVYWFYERLRGQYDEERKHKHTKQDQSYFDFQFPKKKKFSKEDLAKVWANWKQAPYDAVKGASTTYAAYMKSILDNNFLPNEEYYKNSIALIIIYRFLCSRPENKNYANGKASVIAYAMTLLEANTLGRFDLNKVWENQDLSDNTKIYLNQLCDKLYALLSKKVAETNTSILSYCKSKPAYLFVRNQPLGIDSQLLANDLKKL